MRQDFEILALELKVSKTNWLIIGTYKLPSLINNTFTSEIKNVLIFLRSSHGNILLMGDFNKSLGNPNLNEFLALM